MDLFDYIVEYPNVLTKDQCDSIVERFESDDRKKVGCIGVDRRIDTDVKYSYDLNISDHPEWKDIDDLFFNVVTQHTEKYSQYMFENYGIYYVPYSSVGRDDLGTLVDTGYQIQKTPIDGKYEPHNDFQYQYVDSFEFEGAKYISIRERIYTFILYLNDRKGIENGRTMFYSGKDIKYVEAEYGKLVFFPASRLMVHGGEPLTEGVKYLMTGWISALNYIASN